VAPAWEAAVADAIDAAGEVGFDPARVARVSARSAGVVWRAFKAAGDPVRAGELLALVDAAEVGRLKADLLHAASQTRVRRQARDDLRAAGAVVPDPQRREADAAAREAEARLLAADQALANLGLPGPAADLPALPLDDVVRRTRLLGVPEAVAGLDPDAAPATLLPVRAPLDGEVLAADAVAGEVVAAGRVLFTVADPRRVWVTLRVRPEDAGRVQAGRPVRFRTDGSAEDFTGAVIWVGSAADGTTRTVPVRAEFDNPGGRLRASALGRGRVVLAERPRAVVVPPAAVRSFRGTPVVFVRDPGFLKPGGPKAFYPRAVRTGVADARQVEVAAGLTPGEVVATAGSDLLLGELQRAAGEVR
jgi:cobalt-zinc-cadmium efflux system membrane fusion protein